MVVTLLQRLRNFVAASDHLFPRAGIVFEGLEERRLLSASPIEYELEHVLQSSPVIADAHFGQSIAHHNGVLAVGAPGENSVYLIDVQSGDVLNRIDGAGEFGRAVAFVGEMLLIGAPTAQQVHVYTQSGSLEATFADPHGFVGTGFGSNLVSFDNQHVLVYAVQKNGPGAGFTATPGVVYVYDITDLSAPKATFDNPDPVTHVDQFGAAMAVNGNQILIGAANNSRDDNFVSGAAYLFEFDGSTGSFEREITDPQPAEFNMFGGAVGFANGKMLVSSRGDDFDGFFGAGVVYLLDPANGDAVDGEITNPGGMSWQTFGNALAVNADQSQVLIPSVDLISFEGSGYLFDIASGDLIAEVTIEEASGSFGTRALIVGERLVIADPTAGPNSAGAVYVFKPVGDEDPGDPGDPTPVPVQIIDGNLVVTAAATGSQILVFPDSGGVVVEIDGTVFGPFSFDGRIIVHGGEGDDDIRLAGSVGIDAILFGGGGNDVLRGGAGNDILVGGPGDDLLIGHRGRNIMIGGEGSDRLIGHASDDILIAGYTLHDSEVAALLAIQAEWLSSRSFAQRVSNISGETTGGLNGSYFFRTSGTGATVFHGGGNNLLTGGAGSDWFMFSFDDDKVTDLSRWDFAEDLEFVEWEAD